VKGQRLPCQTPDLAIAVEHPICSDGGAPVGASEASMAILESCGENGQRAEVENNTMCS